MSWLDDLSGELRARRMPRRVRHRILLELRDHIECEPGCEDRLGDPRELAVSFADELATSEGTLAAWRALRRRRVASLPAEEIGLIHRRARAALAAGFATMAGLELYVVDFSERLPAWWLGLVGGLAAVAGVGLFAAARTLVRAGDRLGRTRTGGRHLRRSAPCSDGAGCAVVPGS
jgi:hypothetical protein